MLSIHLIVIAVMVGAVKRKKCGSGATGVLLKRSRETQAYIDRFVLWLWFDDLGRMDEFFA